jgi:hypothetical protein
MAVVMVRFLTLALTMSVGCGEEAEGALKCGGVEQLGIEGANHVAPPTMVSYRDNPPASGNHWFNWATWGVAAQPIPREQWVHNLEHGGIVLLYNCPSGCDADVMTLTRIYRERPVDKYNVVRVIINPDTMMPKKFAALAWGWRWQGDTVDEAAIECFIDERYDRAPESVP